MNVTAIGVWGAYPRAGEATSAFLIEEGGFRCLFDCGSGVLSALQNRLPIYELDAVVISHYHPDHAGDIGCLQHALFVETQLELRQKPLSIYGHTKDEDQYDKLTYQDVAIGQPLATGEATTIGPWSVTVAETNHTVFCLAVKFEGKNGSVTFTADTAWSEEVVALARHSHTLISEASTYEDMIHNIPGHLSGKQAGELATKANVQQLILTHLPQYREPTELVKEAATVFGGQTHLAKQFDIYHCKG